MINLVRAISDQQLKWRNDPNIMRYCRQNRILTEADQKKWMETIAEDSNCEVFGIEDDALPTYEMIVGYCALYLGHHRTAEYSILIGPEYQGKGYATKALKLLLDYGFNNLFLERIEGEIFATNPKGRKIAEKAGFKEEGLMKSKYMKEGKRIDCYMYAILKDER